MAEKKIVVLGAGGFGRETMVLLHQMNEVSAQWQILGFYDDAPPAEPDLLSGQPYLGTSHDLNATDVPLHVVIAIGDGQTRARIRQRLTNPLLSFPALIHPSVAVKPYQGIQVGEGTIICQGCILTTNISIGEYVLVNLACTLGHDTVIGDYASLMHHVDLGGHTTVAAYAYLGTNVTVLPSVQVGQDCIIGAGAVVTKTIPPYCTAVGVPAKVIKTHEHLP